MAILHSDGIVALLEGLALIASPCILPLLPLILATSVTQTEHKSRPFLIILGFILSFIGFSLLSRQLILLLNISPNAIQIFAYGFLLLLGLILLFPYLDSIFSRLVQPLANSADYLSKHKYKSVIVGPLFIGFLLGLIWTPCAGPILAAALIQVITAKTNLDVIIIISAFTIGTAIPLLIIALFSQQLIKHTGFLRSHLGFIRKLMGIIIIVFALSGLFKFNLTAWFITPAKAQSSAEIFPTAPQIAGITQWINTPPLTPAQLKGKVILVDFWTYSCVNCIRTLPYIKSWNDKYKKYNFIIIGVHSPEFPFEMDPKNVKAAVKDLGITYPVAMDNNYVTWTNFHNQYWPAHYIISPNNKLVYSHFGEGDYEETENVIRELLHLKKAESIFSETPKGPLSQTPETYLGYERTKNFASPEGIKTDKIQNYSQPKKLERNNWALEGLWNIQKDHITSSDKNSHLMLYFTSQKVYLVLGNQTNQPVKAQIKLNGQTVKDITVDQHKLYLLLDQKSVQNGIVEIIASAPGLEAYAFTFGQ